MTVSDSKHEEQQDFGDRGVSPRFIEAMEEGLEKGRMAGYEGWDEQWEGVSFHGEPRSLLMVRLHQEIDELVLALNHGSPDLIMREAADVANFAMFIADFVNPREDIGHG